MSQTFAIGQYLNFSDSSGPGYFFQNFYIGKDVQYDEGFGTKNYTFLPFGFSGITVSRQGDNVESSLVFPNNELARSWATTAINEKWIAKVRTMLLAPEGSGGEATRLYFYVGQVSSGGWDATTLSLKLNSVLDAVARGIPHRALNQNLCGPIPVTANVRV